MLSKLFRHLPTMAICGLMLLCGSSIGHAQQQLVSAPSTRPLPEQVSFNAHIRPLMSNTCFTCHGPDEENNESGYRIDTFELATGPLPSDDTLVGIDPGNPEGSQVYLRISGQADGEQMPPSDFRHQLSDRDKALFRRWIQQGAEYELHWAYAPIRRPELPQLQTHADEVANPIDAFVLAQLESQQIQPSGLADNATLLRRLSLDLIGLPPTVEELDAFLSDQSPDAYQKQVERLLDSLHYGERMAAHWLDIVRFADTVGFHGDQNQRNFPYRDYVIAAFNQNKPFDQFTREQIAGDLLPNPSDEQLTATGVLRLNLVTREGGAQPNEYLARYKADRVRALGTAWLGSTLACCECHNHKYDPFTAKDFYSLGAFFDDLRQWGVYSDYGYTPNPDLRGFNNDYPFPPELRVDSPSLRAEIRDLQQQRDAAIAAEISHATDAAAPPQSWLTDLAQQLQRHPDGWIPLQPKKATASATTQTKVLDDHSVLMTGEPASDETITITSRVAEPVMAAGLQLEVLPDEQHGGAVGRSDDGRFKLALTARLEQRDEDNPNTVPNHPRYVRVELTGKDKVLSLAEVEILGTAGDGQRKNWALQGKAKQSTDYLSGPASVAIDGNTDGEYHRSKSVTHTAINGTDPWWEVDLSQSRSIDKIVIWNRTDGDYTNRLDGFRLVLLDDQYQVLQTLTPATPDPTLEIAIASEVELQNANEIEIAWAKADRWDPERFDSGAPPQFLGKHWQSGPSRWQLPSDEAKLPHTAVYQFARPIEITPEHQLVVQLASGDVGRVRLSLTPLADAVAGWPAADPQLLTALQTPPAERTDQQQQTLASTHHRCTVPVAQQVSASRYYRDQIAQRHSGLAMTLVAQSIPEDQIPISRVLPRGNWQDESGELAPPAVPHFLPQPDQQSQRRLTRLDLADWLVSPENPLTARHFVNRTWKQFLGTGLSAKLDDLGNQGEWPSHPQLLDWMASEFVDSGWDVKHIVRLIVNSRTYRQRAAVRADLQEVDPYNRLLAQQSARRLEAEIVRDNALAIAGLLQTDYIGGPSIYPYQPDGHYSNLQFPNRNYQASEDERQYRRGVYMHWQRTFLHPMLVNFDAPSRDECTAERTQSNSPQQALTMLNDPSFVEAAHTMAADLIQQHPGADFDTLLDAAFRRALARTPADQERNALSGLYETQREYFQANPAEAQSHVAVGNRVSADNAAAVQTAALAQVCRVILNLHETITRY